MNTRVWPLLVLICTLICCVPAHAIVGSEAENPNDWRSTLLLRTSRGVCTATLVGPSVILTAGYCLGDENTGGVKLNDGAFELKCDAYPDEAALDVALCKLDHAVVETPERLSTGRSLFQAGQTVRLAGIGCNSQEGVDRSIGVLRVGSARVTKIPSEKSGDLYAKIEGAALCFGDGGGGAYVEQADGHRLLVGVNVRGDQKSTSEIAAIETTEFQDWARAWSARNEGILCGLSGEDGCGTSSLGLGYDGGIPLNDFSTSHSAEDLQHLHPIPTTPEVTNLSTSQVLSVATNASHEAVGNRLTKVSSKASESVRDLVTRVCQIPQSEQYFLEFDRAQAQAGTGFDRNTTFNEVREILIPACAPIDPRLKLVTTSDKETAWSLFVAYARDQKPRWKEFASPAGIMNTNADKSKYFLDVLVAVNPGLNVNDLPKKKAIYVPLYPSTAEENTPLVAATADSIEPILAVEPDLGPEHHCVATTRHEGYPYDVSAVLDVLQRNARHLHGEPARVPILMADTGIFGAGNEGIFSDQMLMHRVDEVYLNSITPLLTQGPEAQHGTEVASVMMGGPLFARIQAALAPRIMLGVTRLYRRYVREGVEWIGAEEQAFDLVLRDAKNRAEVVNLSLKTKGQIHALESEFGPDAPILFVVAAGNLDGQLGPAYKNNIYPALYGGRTGRGSSNVITVAAVEGDSPSLAPFSNWGADSVDIAAPGCLIPTLSYDTEENSWKTRELSGTSFAAPLVTFAAAMIKSEFPEKLSAMETKARLLISADLDSNLAAKVADGRVLNIVKALSLYEDVVQTSGNRLLFGDITFSYDGQPLDDNSGSFVVQCEDGPLPLKVGDIYKIRPKFKVVNGMSEAKIYFRAPEGQLFSSKDCTLPEQLDEIVVHTDGGPVIIQINDVVDIVRKHQ
jgi:subtilisin family serine protease